LALFGPHKDGRNWRGFISEKNHGPAVFDLGILNAGFSMRVISAEHVPSGVEGAVVNPSNGVPDK
jgi:hypothetical protein